MYKRQSKNDLEKYAREHINEDPARLKKDVKAIQEWIKKQPHLNKNVRSGNVYIWSRDYSSIKLFKSTSTLFSSDIC